MTQAFFLEMGGLALDMSHDPERVWPIGFDRLTLSPAGYIYLLKHGWADSVPRLSELSSENINDRSKANGLAKAIVCAQAVWFCVQFVSRLCGGLPISLLELNTFAHATCALLIYILWWEKALDVGEPILIHTYGSKRLRELCADIWIHYPKVTDYRVTSTIYHFSWCPLDLRFLSTVSEVPASIDERRPKLYSSNSPLRSPHSVSVVEYADFPCEKAVAKLDGLEFESLVSAVSDAIPFRGLKTAGKVCMSHDPPLLLLRPGDPIPGTDFFVDEGWQSVQITEATLARLQHAKVERVKMMLEGRLTLEGRFVDPVLRSFKDFAKYDCLVRRKNYDVFRLPRYDPHLNRDPPVERLLWNAMNPTQIFSLTLSGAIYGGLHALAWGANALRPGVESILWIASCLIVMSGGPLIVAFSTHSTFRETDRLLKLRWWLTRHLPKIVDIYDHFPTLIARSSRILRYSVGMGYILARLYLVVEIFLAIPYVDPRVYQSLKWSNYWPHIN